MCSRSGPSENIAIIIYNLTLALPLLTEDHDGDVGEHEGVDHEHDQDRTCDRADR